MSLLQNVSEKIDQLNDKIGRAVAWLTLIMVLVQFFVVIFRYVFSVGFIPLQESIWYLHGVIFMVAAGYTLLHNAHVRVDVFYRDTTPKRRAIIDLLGGIIFLLPVCYFTFYYSFGLVVNSWKVFEGSTEANGIPAIFLLKTVIWVFAILLFLQGVSMVIKAYLYIIGEGDHYDQEEADEFLSEEFLEEVKNSENKI